jgi:SAM-dependent MidA family methyltransferase
MSTPPLPQPPAQAIAHSAALARAIAAEIAGAGGWLDFSRYMELALYAPGAGYYTGETAKLGAAGDFATAPELSPLFSRTVARQVAELLSVADGDVLELGAGSGRMAVDMLSALQELGQAPLRYRILEVSAELQARQRDAVAHLPPGLAQRVEWVQQLPASIEGVVIANEVLDALPVRLVAWRVDEPLERGVVWRGGGFAFADRPIDDRVLLREAKRLSPPPPYVSEIGLAGHALVRSLAQRLVRGALLFIDYGFGEAEYYHPQRSGGTLMCHYRHRAHDDPLLWPGLQDITAHVNFSAIAGAARASGLQLLGYTTQAHFLVNLGITDLLGRTPADRPAAYLPQAAQVHKLLSPAEMGELFKVIVFGRDVALAPTGMRAGEMSRLL